MNPGTSLTQIAAELERQVNSRKDFIAPSGVLVAKAADKDIAIDGFNGGAVGLTNHAHRQLSDALGIPQKYYERMRAVRPDLLAQNVNGWFAQDPENRRMLRTLDGRVRAVMSPKFRPLDNYDLANAVLPTLLDKGVQIQSAQLTETRLYIKCILPSLSDALPDGMVYGQGHNILTKAFGADGRIVAAIVISNSEVGAGALRVEPSVFTTFCTNLAVLTEASMRKYHVGRSFDNEDNTYEVFSDETRRQDDRAFWMKVKDVTLSAFSEDGFRAAIAQIRNAAAQPIVSNNLPKVVEVAVKRLALPEAAGTSILAHLAKGGDLSQWGLSSAVTSAANEADDYELSTDLERAGGKVIALSPSEWNVIAAAA